MSDETATVLLNNLPYVVKLPIRHYGVPTQTEAFRTTGAFLRTNNPKLEPYAFNDWHRGLGTRFVRPGHPEDRQGFYDATVQTCWPNVIVLPMTRIECTDVADYAIRASDAFQGRLWVLWRPNDDDAASNTVVARSAGGDSLAQGGGIVFTEAANGNGVEAYDLKAAGGRLFAILGTSDDHILRYSDDGITWSAPATTPPPSNLLTNKATMLAAWDDGARLCILGTRVVLALKDTVAGEIEVWDSTNSGNVWNSRVTVKSGNGPTGLVPYLDTEGTVKVYLGTSEGLYILDLAAATATADLVLPLPGNDWDCMRMAVHNGSLYIPVDNGDDAPFGMKKLTIVGSERIVEDIGLDMAQEIPSDLLGPVSWMTSMGSYLLVSVGGQAASRNSRILSITGHPDHGWQNVHKYGTANDPINWIGADANSLYWQEGGAGSTDPGDCGYFNRFLERPEGNTNKNYQATGDLQLPEFGGDAPSENGGWFQIQVDAVDMVDAAEVIDFEYGLNGASPTTSGPTLDNSTRSQNLGTSNRGLSARTIRPNLEFNRGSGSVFLTPKLREFVLLFRKNPDHLHGWELEIDIEATRTARRGEVDIYDEFETISHSDILVPFVEYQALGEVEVEMVFFDRKDWLRGGELDRQNAWSEGTIKIQLEEILAH